MGSPRVARPVEEADLHAFVDGELDAARYREVVAHIGRDPHAAERVDDLLRQRQALSSLGDALSDLPESPEIAALEMQLLDGLRAKRRLRHQLMAAAAAVVLFLGAAAWWGPQLARAVLAPSIVTAAKAPGAPPLLFGGALPVATSVQATSESERIQPWLRRVLPQLDGATPQFDDLGLFLIGSNVTADADTPIVRLVYSDAEAKLMVLFLGVVPDGLPAAARLAADGDVALSWRNGEQVASLVAPSGAPWLPAVLTRVEQMVRSDAVASGGHSSLLADPPPADGSGSLETPPTPASVVPTLGTTGSEPKQL